METHYLGKSAGKFPWGVQFKGEWVARFKTEALANHFCDSFEPVKNPDPDKLADAKRDPVVREPNWPAYILGELA